MWLIVKILVGGLVGGVSVLLVVGVLIAVVYLVFGDLFARFFPKHRLFKPFIEKPLTTTNYVGVVILAAFVVWPFAKEVSIGGLTVKKLDQRIADVEERLDDLFARKRTEKWFHDDFVKLKVTELKNASSTTEWFEYHIPLKNAPIKNSVSLWLGPALQNPLYYTFNEKENEVVFRHQNPMNVVGPSLQMVKPALTVEYFISK